MSKLSDLCEELIREDYYDDYERFTKGVMKISIAARVMEQTLNEIKKVRYGLELGDSDDYQIEYWSNLSIEYRQMVIKSLNEVEKILGEKYE